MVLISVLSSRAILGYLVDQYGKDDSLYPKDIKERTRINQMLYFDMGTLYQRFSDYYVSTHHWIKKQSNFNFCSYYIVLYEFETWSPTLREEYELDAEGAEENIWT